MKYSPTLQDSDIHIVLDLETLSTAHNAAIIQIGAHAIADGIIIDSLNIKIDPTSTEFKDFHTCIDTLEWWNKQDPELRKEVFSGKSPLGDALDELLDWVQAENSLNCSAKDVYVWCRGPEFDWPILDHAYKWRAGFNPFDFRKVQSLRTVDLLLPESVKEKTLEEFSAVYPNAKAHDAWVDSKFGAFMLVSLLKNL